MHLPSPKWTSSWPEWGPLSVWRLRLDALSAPPEDLLRPLTIPSEHERARRYQFEADRHRHLGGRALARLVLSRRLDRAPQALTFDEGPHGKPHLEPSPDDGPPLHFNVAHTGDVVLVVVSQGMPVGIDVESRAREMDAAALADRVCTEAERAWWRGRPESHRHDAFLHLWTCKEAFLKATGEGLQRAPDTIECRVDGSTVRRLDDATESPSASPSAPAANWAVRPFSAADGVVGALVHPQDHVPPVSWVDATGLLPRTPTT